MMNRKKSSRPGPSSSCVSSSGSSRQGSRTEELGAEDGRGDTRARPSVVDEQEEEQGPLIAGIDVKESPCHSWSSPFSFFTTAGQGKVATGAWSLSRRFPEPSFNGDVDNWAFKMDRPTTPITAFSKIEAFSSQEPLASWGKLRTCPEVQTVYILIRPKSGSDVQARLEELLDNSLYDTIRQDDPDVLKKIVPVSGDITLPYLGISEQDQQTLAEEVSVVIHSAATVKFDEKLKLSINVNVQGTKRIVELCKRMTKLAALVHVSTAYANCEREEIDEIVYPPPADPNKLIQCMEWMDDDVANWQQAEYVHVHQGISRAYFDSGGYKSPIVHCRPSIVTATWKEPVAGWVDNVNGPTGLIAACGKGVLRTLLCHRNKVADLIPLDFPVNLILSAAWYTAEHKNKSLQLLYGNSKPLLWGDLENWGFKHLVSNPLSDVLWYPAASFKTNKVWHNINDFFIHYVPAYMMDIFASLTGRKPVMLKIYKKITKAVQSLQYFTVNQWQFNTDNMVALYEFLSPEDQRMFSFNVREVNWPTYMENTASVFHAAGCSKTCSKSKKLRFKKNLCVCFLCTKLYWVHKFTQFFLILIFWRAIMFRCETARQLWSFMFGMVLRMARMLPIGEAI
ncbi:hypothetical protein Ocin01_11637 [Orchesella cincta]|uniref:Fatty acyl-CoA reductase n=1 Tax=Orchesella cincta TaxID=48709 RepID=A0A1D2MPK8_ORCCI|nr:hypothetical protein Ocin01_11637 [Orchesella cincta]